MRWSRQDDVARDENGQSPGGGEGSPDIPGGQPPAAALEFAATRSGRFEFQKNVFETAMVNSVADSDGRRFEVAHNGAKIAEILQTIDLVGPRVGNVVSGYAKNWRVYDKNGNQVAIAASKDGAKYDMSVWYAQEEFVKRGVARY